MKTATKKRKKKAKLKGGTNAGPSLDTWTKEAKELESAQAADAKPNSETNGSTATLEGHPLHSPDAKEVAREVLENALNGVPADGSAEPMNRIDPAKAYDSPEALAEYDADTAREAEERRRTRSGLWSKEEASKAAHKADKAAAEEYDTAFFDWLRERNEERGKPPQPKPAKLYPDPSGEVAQPALPVTPAPGDDSWKSIPLSELAEKDGFPGYLIEKLANAQRKDDRPQAPITTLGELTAFTEPEASGYTKKLVDLVGIGAGAVEKIGEACIKFWERWAKEHASNPSNEASGVDGDSDGPGEAAGDDEE